MNMHVVAITNTVVCCAIAIVTLHVRPVISSHNPGQAIDPSLQLAAYNLRSLCSNFLECGTDRWATGGSLCCLKCSCDPSCNTTHSCCPESGYHPTGEISYNLGNEGMVCQSGVRVGMSKGKFIHPDYEFLQRCPADAPTNVKDKCNQAFAAGNVSIIRSLPLYDTVRGINYANIYCALCNNASELNLVPWAPSLSCREAIDSVTLTLSEIDDRISIDDCSLIYDPPEQDISHTICYNDVITTCNVTGNWLTYDVTVELNCDVLDMIYVPVIDRSRTFKNIFCALCNGIGVGQMYSVDYCPFVNSEDFSMSFFTVLLYSVDDLNRYSDNRTDSFINAKRCLGNFAFDPLMGRCMPVYCSSPLILDTPTFQCKTLFGKTGNAIVSHTFTILFDERVTFDYARNKAVEIVDMIRAATEGVCTINLSYRTTLHASDVLDDVTMNSTAEEITGVYINARYLLFGTVPKDDISKTKQTIKQLFNNTLYAYMGSETFDPGMLQYIANDDVQAIESRPGISVFNLTGPSHYMYRNPYDNTVIIGEQNYRLDACVETMYKTDFLSCPWFRYGVTRFSKTTNGLVLSINGRVEEFGFDEFKTIRPNSTEVKICSEALIDKVAYLSSSQINNSISIFSKITMLMCALFINV